MFWGLCEDRIHIPSGDLNYLSFGKGQKNLIIIQGLNVRDIQGAGASLVLIIRNGVKLIPNGNTVFQENDLLIMCGQDSSKIEGVNLYEKVVEDTDDMVNKKIKEISLSGKLIILIKRKEKVIIPKGNTVICADDVLVINDENQ